MPTYDYVCEACKNTWEEFKSMTAPVTKKCPKCGKSKARRLIGPGAGVIFKGSGFYQTDYRSDSYKKSADADSKASSASESKSSDSKSETKSESKSESKSSDKGGKKD